MEFPAPDLDIGDGVQPRRLLGELSVSVVGFATGSASTPRSPK
ncbi:hypothetical protein ACFYQ5_03720 [Streptomyces sp. NPDC005794]